MAAKGEYNAVDHLKTVAVGVGSGVRGPIKSAESFADRLKLGAGTVATATGGTIIINQGTTHNIR